MVHPISQSPGVEETPYPLFGRRVAAPIRPHIRAPRRTSRRRWHRWGG